MSRVRAQMLRFERPGGVFGAGLVLPAAGHVPTNREPFRGTPGERAGSGRAFAFSHPGQRHRRGLIERLGHGGLPSSHQVAISWLTHRVSRVPEQGRPAPSVVLRRNSAYWGEFTVSGSGVPQYEGACANTDQSQDRPRLESKRAHYFAACSLRPTPSHWLESSACIRVCRSAKLTTFHAALIALTSERGHYDLGDRSDQCQGRNWQDALEAQVLPDSRSMPDRNREMSSASMPAMRSPSSGAGAGMQSGTP